MGRSRRNQTETPPERYVPDTVRDWRVVVVYEGRYGAVAVHMPCAIYRHFDNALERSEPIRGHSGWRVRRPPSPHHSEMRVVNSKQVRGLPQTISQPVRVQFQIRSVGP